MINCYDKYKYIDKKIIKHHEAFYYNVLFYYRRRHSLFYMVVHFAVVTVRPTDLISRVYKTQQLVYRCAKKRK